MRQANRIDEETLQQLYVNQRLSLQKISNLLSRSTESIRHDMMLYGVPRRTQPSRLPAKFLMKLYLKEKLSTLEIAKRTDRSKHAIRRALIYYNIPRRSACEARKLAYESGRAKSNEVDLSMNETLSYILGVLYGDGFVYSHASRYELGLRARNKLFVEAFSKAVKKLGLKTHVYYRDSCRSDKKPIFSSVFYSIKIYKWFKNLTLLKLERLLTKEEYITSFLRGFYESEGSLGERMLEMSNTRHDLILLIQRLLAKLEFRSHIYKRNDRLYKNGVIYRIYLLGGKKELKRFLLLVNPCIKNEIGG